MADGTTTETAVTVAALAVAAVSFFISSQTDALDAMIVSNRRLASIHDHDAIHIDEVFSRGEEGRGIIVLDVASSGTLTDHGHFSPTLPPIGAGSTRLTLIDLQAQGGGPSIVPEGLTTPRGNLLHHSGKPRPLPSFEENQSSMFDAWDLMRLWAPDSVRHPAGSSIEFRPWQLTTSILGSFIATRELNEDATLSGNRAFYLGPHSVEVWDYLSSVQTRGIVGGGTEIVCFFGTLPLKFIERGSSAAPVAASQSSDTESGLVKLVSKLSQLSRPPKQPEVPHHDVRQFSPLKDHFCRILRSRNPACSIGHTGEDVTIILVVIDLLRAAIECWIVHATLFTRRVLSLSDHLGRQDRIANLESWQKLQRVPRDLQAALDFAFDTAMARTETSGPWNGAAPLRQIKLEADAKLRTVRNIVDDFAKSCAALSDAKVALVQEDQARSVKRLTLLASVFLPISLAAGLLSMSSRAIDLGILWYDFIGVSAFLISMVFVVYQFMRIRDGFHARWDAIVASSFYNLRNPLLVLPGDLIRQQLVMVLQQIRGLSASDVVPLFCWLLLPIPFIVSFGVGMFDNMGKGLYVLQTGLAVAALLISVIAFVQSLLSWVWYRY